MAHEMKTKLFRMNVVVGVAKFERISKSDADLEPLIAAARACLSVQQQVAGSVKAPAQNVEIAG